MSEIRELDLAGGVTLRVYADGEPSSSGPVVLLHGFTGDASTMSELASLLGAHQTVRPDLVGHGASSSPDEPGHHGVDAMASQVGAVIDSYGGRCHLVGYSMGGRVALTLAASRPEAVASLSLIGATAGIADPIEAAARREADDRLAQTILDDGIEAFVDVWMANPLFASQASRGGPYLAHARQQRLANRPDALARSLREGGTGSMQCLFGQLGRIIAPTVLIVGGIDTKFAGIAAAMANELPEARVAAIGGVGHAAHVENPLGVAEVIIEQIEAAS